MVHHKIEGIAEGEDPNHNPDQRDEVANENGRIAVNQPHFFGENTGEHHAHQATNAVAGEHVQCIINGKTRLEPDGPVADQ